MRAIKEGDIVEVYFYWNLSPMYHMKVLHTPSDTGDSWYLRDRQGLVYAVQTFAYMKKLLDEDEEEYKTCGHCGGDMTQRFIHSFGSSLWKCSDCGYSSVTGD